LWEGSIFPYGIRKNQPSKFEKTDRKTDKTALLSDEVNLRQTKRAHPFQDRPLKNLTITQKRNTPAFFTEVFQLELMTGFEPVTSSLPSNEVPSKAGDFGN